MSYSPFCPVDVRVIQKNDASAVLRKLLSGRAHQLLVLAPRHLCEELALSLLFSNLREDGHTLLPLLDIPTNPTVAHLAASLTLLRKQAFEPTCVLTIGGGSCIDLAKGISALWFLAKGNNFTDSSVRNAILAKEYDKHPFLDIIAVPTTAGTGSEVTHWATIWDTHEKLSIDCPACFPKAAILIPEWTAGMPSQLTLSTGLDALCHAVESFWAKARTPLSQAHALSAVDGVRRFLPLALKKPSDISIRQEMCIASLLAGLAFSQTRTTACHSLSYPLTLYHGLPHGFAAATTLLPVMRRNQAVLPEINRLSELFAPDGGIAAWLQKTCAGIHSLRLSSYGISEDKLAAIAEAAFTKGRMDNNPVVFTPRECLEILEECL